MRTVATGSVLVLMQLLPAYYTATCVLSSPRQPRSESALLEPTHRNSTSPCINHLHTLSAVKMDFHPGNWDPDAHPMCGSQSPERNPRILPHSKEFVNRAAVEFRGIWIYFLVHSCWFSFISVWSENLDFMTWCVHYDWPSSVCNVQYGLVPNQS